MAREEIVASQLTEPEPATEQVVEPTVSIVTVEKQNRRRRRLRIVLVLIVFFTVIGFSVWAASHWGDEETSEVEEKSPAIKMADLVAKFKSDPKNSTLHISDFAIDDSIIPSLSELDAIETLILDQGVLTDASIATIVTLPNLRQLRLRLSPITDDGLQELANCSTLMFVNLPHCKCTVRGIMALGKLPKLRQLRIGSPELTNEATREIAKLKTLQTVHLIGVPVTDDGLKILAEMPQLESLYLDDSLVTEAGWLWLFQRHAHLHVHINQKHHDRDPQHHEHHD